MPARNPSTLLPNGWVVRRPTDAELARRVPIELTERDVDLLVHVHKLGFLTADLVEEAFFPPAGAARRSRSSCCYDRLQQLWLWRYLERAEPPVARLFRGRRADVHALGPRGAPIVEAALGAERPIQRRPVRRVDDRLIAHDRTAAALWASLRAVVRTRRLAGLRWEGEREVRARGWSVAEARTGRRVPVVPDAYAELSYPDGSVECVLVEVDMGTLSLRRVRAKVAAFERLRDEGRFARATGYEDFEVWVLAPSPRRLETLRRAAQSVVGSDRRGAYLLATHAVLERGTLARATWCDLDRVGRSAIDDGELVGPDPREDEP